MTQCLMCRFATPETGYSRYIHSWSGLWGWLVLILIAQHSRCISHHDKLLLWWGNGEMSPNHSRTILVYHLKCLFFYLAIRALWDVYPRILVDKELEKEEINTQLRAMVNPSELLPSSPINTFQCLSPVAGLDVCFSVLFFLMDPLVHMLFFWGLSLFRSHCSPCESQTPTFCQYMLILSAGAFHYDGLCKSLDPTIDLFNKNWLLCILKD